MDIPQDAQIDDPTRPQGVWRLRRMFLTRPPRAAKTALAPVGTSQGDGRLRTPLGAIFNILLFYRHAFGQVPRLIHIRAAQRCNMIRQKLQWNREQNR